MVASTSLLYQHPIQGTINNLLKGLIIGLGLRTYAQGNLYIGNSKLGFKHVIMGELRGVFLNHRTVKDVLEGLRDYEKLGRPRIQLASTYM